MFKIILILIFALASTPSFSQVRSSDLRTGKTLWQKNGVVINDSQGRSIRRNAKVVGLDDNSSVMVWEDERNGYTDIYAQRLSAGGAKLWGDGGVGVCEAPGSQTFPQIISDGKSVIITWQDYRNGNADIYSQKLNISGSAIWAKDGIPVCTSSTNQLEPQLAPDGAGGAIITWYDYRSGKGEDIYAQKMSKAGSPEWQVDGVPVCTEMGTQWYPKIISDGSGGAVICWDDKRGDDYDIYAQRLDSKGSPVWQMNGIPVCKAFENQEYCQIASCEGDSFVITWQDYRNRNADIYAQRINSTGMILWKTDGEVVCNVAGNQERPQIAGGKNPIISWIDFRNGTGNSDIFCQKMSSTGIPMWDPYGASVCEAPGNQTNPRAVPDGSGGAIITWQDQRSVQGGIFARRVNNDGKVLWVPDGKTVCSTSYGAEFPQITISKNDGKAVIAWQDKRNGGLDIYAQSLDLNGVESWRKDGLGIVFGFGSATQQKPKIKRIDKEAYMVAWEDYRNGYSNVYAQMINNKGKLLWALDGVRVCNAESNQYNPELISDDDGGAIIVWEDTRSGVSNIYAQKIDRFGNVYWNEGGIKLCQSEKNEINPKLVKDTKGGAIVAWEDSRKREGVYNIYAQRIDQNGSLLWRIDGIAVKVSEGTQVNPDIGSDGEEGAVITWEEYRRNLNTPDIYAQRISGSGNVLWTNNGLTVCKAPESQKHPAMSVGGEIMIAWEDSGSGNYDIYAQKLSKDGTIAWAADGVPVCTAPFTQIGPKLMLEGDGGATFVWEDYRNANWDIYAQRLDTAGRQMWATDGIEICGAPGTQYAPQFVKSSGLSNIIVWEDYRNNESYNIYAQKLSDSGEALWEKDGVPICVTEGGARNPQLADDGKSGAVVVWTDYRYGTYDIYAQRINEIENK
jgi:hypothetical protein